MRRSVLALSALALLVAPVAAAVEEPTFVMGHVGRLYDGEDVPVEAEALDITFAVFAVSAPIANERAIWTGTYRVRVSKGMYYVALGSGDTPLPTSVFPMDEERYLQVTVGGTELRPRMHVGAMPLAANAAAVGGRRLTELVQKTELALSHYDRSEMDALLAEKATVAALEALKDDTFRKADTYDRAALDAALATKADKAAFEEAKTALEALSAGTYTKEQADALLGAKADVTALNAVKATANAKVASVAAGNGTITIGGPATAPTVAVNTASVQARVTGTCPAGQAISTVNADGSVVCIEAEDTRVIRYAVWSTYDQSNGWIANNDASLFGGVKPQSWTDGNARAWQMSNDAETLRTLFNRKLYAGANAIVNSNTYYAYSSTDGQMSAAFLRIRNSTPNAIAWQPCFYYTAYNGWSEYASLSLNGASNWDSNTGYGSSNTCVNLTIPANRVSTMILVAGSSPPNGTRTNFLAFFGGRLNLPAGLAFVDDLDRLSGAVW